MTGVLRLRGLKAGTRYFVRVLDGGSELREPVLQFTTAPRTAERVRFAWGADLYEGLGPLRLFDELSKQAPDFFLLLGDTVYADWEPLPASNLEGFRQKHRSIRADPHLQRVLMNTPVVATWDDHEVENNFDCSHPAIQAGKQAFEEYWPSGAQESASGGLFRSFDWGGLVEVFLLDTRSFREVPGQSTRSMLGHVQLDWLLRGLSASKAPLKFIASSVPFHAPFGPDTWFGFPHERARIVEHVRREKISGVAVVSGDLHLAWDLSAESSGIYEFVAGPCGAPTFAELFPARVPTVRRMGAWHLLDVKNFGLVTVERRAGYVEAAIEVVDEHGRKHSVRRISAPLEVLAEPPRQGQ